MNYDPYFILQLQTLLSTSIHILDENGRILFPEGAMYGSDLACHDEINAYFRAVCKEMPKIFQKDEVYFGGFCQEGICYVIGPCSIGSITFSSRYKFAKKYGMKGDEICISEISRQVLGDALALLYYQISGRKILSHEIWREPIVEKGKEFAGISEKETLNYSVERNVLNEYQHTSYAEERTGIYGSGSSYNVNQSGN